MRFLLRSQKGGQKQRYNCIISHFFRMEACETAYGKEKIDKLVLMKRNGVGLEGYDENPFQYKFLPQFQKPNQKIDKYYKWYYERWALLRNQKLKANTKNGSGSERWKDLRESPFSRSRNDRTKQDTSHKESRENSRRSRNSFLKDGIGRSKTLSDKNDPRTWFYFFERGDGDPNNNNPRTPSIEDKKDPNIDSFGQVGVKRDDSSKDRSLQQDFSVEPAKSFAERPKCDIISSSAKKPSSKIGAPGIVEKIEKQEALTPKRSNYKGPENTSKLSPVLLNIKCDKKSGELKANVEETEDGEIKCESSEQKVTTEKKHSLEDSKLENEKYREGFISCRNNKESIDQRSKNGMDSKSVSKDKNVSRSNRKHDNAEDHASKKKCRKSSKHKDGVGQNELKDRSKRVKSRSRSPERRRRRWKSRSRERKRLRTYNSPDKSRQHISEKNRKYSPDNERKHNYTRIVEDYRKKRLKSKTPSRNRHMKCLHRERTISRPRERRSVSRANKRHGTDPFYESSWRKNGAKESKTENKKQKEELKASASSHVKDNSTDSSLILSKTVDTEEKFFQPEQWKGKRNEDYLYIFEVKCSENDSKTTKTEIDLAMEVKQKNPEAKADKLMEVVVSGNIPHHDGEPIASNNCHEHLSAQSQVDAPHGFRGENIVCSRSPDIGATEIDATHFNVNKCKRALIGEDYCSCESRTDTLKRAFEKSPEILRGHESTQPLLRDQSADFTPKRNVQLKQKGEVSDIEKRTTEISGKTDDSESDKENSQPTKSLIPKLKLKSQLRQNAERPALCVLPCRLESPRLASNDVLSSILGRMEGLAQNQKNLKPKTSANSDFLKNPSMFNKFVLSGSSNLNKEKPPNIISHSAAQQVNGTKTNSENKNSPIILLANFDSTDFSNELSRSYEDSCSVIPEIDSFLEECLQLDNFLKLGKMSSSSQMESKEKPNWKRWKEWKERCEKHDTEPKAAECEPNFKLENRLPDKVESNCAKQVTVDNSSDNLNPLQFCDLQFVELLDENASISDAFASDGTIMSGDVGDTQKHIVSETAHEFFSEEAMFNLTALERKPESQTQFNGIESSEDDIDFEDVNIGKLVVEMETMADKSSVIEPIPEQLDLDSESEWLVNRHKKVCRRKNTSKTKLQIDSSEDEDDGDHEKQDSIAVSPSRELSVMVDSSMPKFDRNGNIVLNDSGLMKPNLSNLSTSSFVTFDSSGKFSECSSKSSNSVASFRQKVISCLKKSNKSGKCKYCKPRRRLKNRKISSNNSYSVLPGENMSKYSHQQPNPAESCKTDTNMATVVNVDEEGKDNLTEQNVVMSDYEGKISEEFRYQNLELCNNDAIENVENISESDEDFDDAPRSPEIGRRIF